VLGGLTQLGCRYGFPLTIHVDAGTSYYFQIGTSGQDGGQLHFVLEAPPPPSANFSYGPGDPSAFDTMQFCDNSYDSAQAGYSDAWDFGVVAGDQAVTGLMFTVDAPSRKPGDVGIADAPIAITGLFQISDGGHFRETVRAQQTTVVFEGSLRASGTATGSLLVDGVVVHPGMPRRWTTGHVAWTAQLVAPAY
jgi:hypothetical protein